MRYTDDASTTKLQNKPTRVGRAAGKFLGVVSLMNKTLPERASLGSTETVGNTQAQPLPGRSDREVIVVGGSAAGLLTAATVARGGRRVAVLESRPPIAPAPATVAVK